MIEGGYMGFNVGKFSYKIDCGGGFVCDNFNVLFSFYGGVMFSFYFGVELGYFNMGSVDCGGGYIWV